MTMEPESVTVPVEMERMQSRLLFPEVFIVRVVAVREPPLTAIELFPLDVGEFIVTGPLIVNEFVPLIDTVVTAPAEIVSDAATPATSTVQLAPAAITASTPAVGTPAFHRTGSFHVPVPENVD